MIDKNVFCSSPWLHFRIMRTGVMRPCRWAYPSSAAHTVALTGAESNVRDTSIIKFFNSIEVANLRTQLLTGDAPKICSSCYYEDSFDKVSGRKKQLFRSKLDNVDTFDESFTKSPHYKHFKYSQENNGLADCAPFDLQIDLDNTCNGACIMCGPQSSSMLTKEFQQLNKIDPRLFKVQPSIAQWSTDPALVQKVVDDLKQLPYIDYLHLLGGETLFVESFYTICEALIEADMARGIILGTTTNGTIFTPRLEKLISEFRAFHLGISIESTNHINDYIRYPAGINSVLSNLDKFLDLRDRIPTLHLQLRITPNIFTIFYFDEVIQYMIDKNITAESCNILSNPSVLRMELLPDDLKQTAIDKLKAVADKNLLTRAAQIVDTRNPDLAKQVMADVLFSYIDFLESMQQPENIESERHDLVKFLKAFEEIHNNSILTYAPEFASFLIQYGY